ncbi:hypothetical protein [Clostridium neonatale]|jgi:hypothetical protein|uniref:hypothetical protein n=1 Tax=Clostridium neonatale TaxID=137838 RepID=UPI00258FA18B|nr:hypothetical protein [Clostridium neonatale]CAI3207822.1 hypothetical protein CNEO2_360055 [Clostridium neonatale]
MKIEKIKKLTVEEFEKELNQENFNYIEEVYSSFIRALEVYKEGAEESGKDDYLDINEYFTLDKTNLEDYNGFI